VKTVKPQKLSVLVSPFEAGGKLRLCITTMLAAPFDAPESPIHEASLWRMLAEHLGRDVPVDLCRPKPVSEVVVVGSAYPRNPPQVACSVRLALQSRWGRERPQTPGSRGALAIDKTLWVVGDRVWGRAGVASDPVPFTSMPVRWANAFGGPGLADNPVGKGLAPVSTGSGEVHPLPNVEHPRRLIGSRGDRPTPVGFAPLDLRWPERYSRVGTYDRAWREHQYPGLPLDFDFAFYNTAPLDQRLDGHFQGDETFTLEGMHPTLASIEGRLPSFVPRAFVDLRGGEFREVPMRMDTLQLYPDALTMVVIYRGVTPIVEDDASDVLHLVAACDAPGALRPIDHYRAVLAERLDMKRAAEASLRQGDLMPPGPAARVRFDEIGDPDLRAQPEQLRAQNAHRRASRELEAQRRQLTARGEDPDKYLPRALPPLRVPTVTSAEEHDAWRAEIRAQAARTRAGATAARERAEAGARRACEATGSDYDAIMTENKRRAAGPPKLSAWAELGKLRSLVADARRAGRPDPEAEARLADPGLAAKLRRAEEAQRDLYRKHAHEGEAALPADGALAERARIELPAGAQGGVCFEERDLTGVDLHGLDLRGVDLRQAFLEGADLSGCDLRGANLTRAVLARARLDGADLTGAQLAGANLGKASLVGVKLEGSADLTGAVLVGADLTRASLRAARLDRVDLSEARFEDTDFSGVVGEGVTFTRVDLRGLRLAGASLRKGSFLEVDARGVDFSGTDLTGATFQGAKASRAIFRGATLHKLRAVRGSVFDGADFLGAKLARANLRFMSLVGCDFSGADLDHADLSGCDLQEANLHRAVACGARFVQADLRRANLTAANLMHALMGSANLRGANLTSANLFRVDLCRAEVDRGTITKDANLTQIRFVPARKPDGEALHGGAASGLTPQAPSEPSGGIRGGFP
jgi:uncharacterized protein YjbI with pentapeptide repeats